MALRNFVREDANNPGTGGSFVLLGPPTGREGFLEAFGNGGAAYYFAEDGTQWETAVGTANAGSPNNTLSRPSTVIANSAGTTARINFTGPVRVYCALPAERNAYVLPAGGLSVSAAALGAPLWGGNAAGTANALELTLSPPILALLPGTTIRFAATADNTGPATLAVNGLPPSLIRQTDQGSPLTAGLIAAGMVHSVTWDGLVWRLDPPMPRPLWGGTAGGTANALTLAVSPVMSRVQVGTEIRFLPGSANTGAATLAVNAIAAAAIVNARGAPLVPGELSPGVLASVVWDGTAYRLRRSPDTLAAEVTSTVSAVEFTIPADWRAGILSIVGLRASGKADAYLQIRRAGQTLYDTAGYTFSFLGKRVETPFNTALTGSITLSAMQISGLHNEGAGAGGNIHGQLFFGATGQVCAFVMHSVSDSSTDGLQAFTFYGKTGTAGKADRVRFFFGDDQSITAGSFLLQRVA